MNRPSIDAREAECSRLMKGLLLGACLVAGLLRAMQAAWALPIEVTLDTTSLSGTAATLAFDLTAGSSAVGNTVIITGFGSDGTLGAALPPTGAASGDLFGTTVLRDTAFFSELLQGITLGNSLHFTLGVGGNVASLPLPAEFAFFVLDSTATSSLLTTSDPTGANALLTLDITGTPEGNLTPFSSLVSVRSVPEPSSLWLAALGLVLTAVWIRRSKAIKKR